VDGKVIVLFGGPRPNLCVRYYEENRIASVYFAEADGTLCFVDSDTDVVVASILAREVTGHEDLFIIECFVDDRDNIVFIAYGFSWRGTWAAGVYLHDFLLGRLSWLVSGYYVFHWVDADNDGIPQADEITREYP